MKHLQSFSLFEARASRLPSGLTPDQESFLNQYTQGTWSVNPTTGLVDVQGDFNRYGLGLKSLQGISFGHVSGDFYCNNSLLTTLVGAPTTVGGGFYCHDNQLTTLAGAPTTVNGDFYCYNNQLTTLEGAPTTVGGNFSCEGNHQLTTLAGAPTTVNGYFSCNNSLLTTLVGAPTTVGVDFYCHDNQLTTLAGAPTTVNGDFRCYDNRLTTLAGAPTKVGGGFYCHDNQLTTLAGAPTTVDGGFYCSNNRLTTLVGAPTTVDGGFYCDAFSLESEEWNPAGWVKIAATGDDAARRLILTLPQLHPEFWLNLHQKDRRTFNRIWLDCRRDPEIRRTLLYQEVEGALSGQARSNLDDLQDLRDLGI
jgi:hypothetical protein